MSRVVHPPGCQGSTPPGASEYAYAKPPRIAQDASGENAARDPHDGLLVPMGCSWTLGAGFGAVASSWAPPWAVLAGIAGGWLLGWVALARARARCLVKRRNNSTL